MVPFILVISSNQLVVVPDVASRDPREEGEHDLIVRIQLGAARALFAEERDRRSRGEVIDIETLP